MYPQTLKIPCFGWDSFEICILTLAHLPRKKAALRSPFSPDAPHFSCRILAQLHASQVKCAQELLRSSMFYSCKEPWKFKPVLKENKKTKQQKGKASLERSVQLPHVSPGAASSVLGDATHRSGIPSWKLRWDVSLPARCVWLAGSHRRAEPPGSSEQSRPHIRQRSTYCSTPEGNGRWGQWGLDIFQNIWSNRASKARPAQRSGCDLGLLHRWPQTGLDIHS